MTRRVSIPRLLLVVIALAACAALVGGLLVVQLGRPAAPGLTAERVPATPDADAGEAGATADADAADAGDADADLEEDGDELNEEAQEQAELIGRKREALDRAVAGGAVIGQQRPAGDAPTAGWAGEQPFEASAP